MKASLCVLSFATLATISWGKLAEVSPPSSVRWVFKADLDALKKTETGMRLLHYLKTGPSSNQIAAIGAIFRLDMFQDLNSIILWGRASEPDANTLVLKGRFNAPHLETLVRANGRYQESKHRAYDVHSWVDDGKAETERQYGCIHPTGVLILSKSRSAVEEALDTLDGKQSSLSPIQTFGFSPPPDAPLFYANTETLSADIPLPEPYRAAIGVTWITAYEREKTVHLSLGFQTANADSARLLRDVVQGLVAIGQMAQDADVLDLLAPARVEQEETRVFLSTTATPDLVFRMLKKYVETSTEQTRTAAR